MNKELELEFKCQLSNAIVSAWVDVYYVGVIEPTTGKLIKLIQGAESQKELYCKLVAADISEIKRLLYKWRTNVPEFDARFSL